MLLEYIVLLYKILRSDGEVNNQENSERSILDFVARGFDNTNEPASWSAASSEAAKPTNNKQKVYQNMPKLFPKWMRESASKKNQPKINSFFKKDSVQA